MVWRGWDLALVTPWRVPVLAFCAVLGMLAHIAGDMLTHGGCPVWYPASRDDHHLLPYGLQFTTGKLAEHWIVSPLLLAALGFLLWRDASGALIAARVR